MSYGVLFLVHQRPAQEGGADLCYARFIDADDLSLMKRPLFACELPEPPRTIALYAEELPDEDGGEMSRETARQVLLKLHGQLSSLASDNKLNKLNGELIDLSADSQNSPNSQNTLNTLVDEYVKTAKALVDACGDEDDALRSMDGLCGTALNVSIDSGTRILDSNYVIQDVVKSYYVEPLALLVLKNARALIDAAAEATTATEATTTAVAGGRGKKKRRCGGGPPGL